MLSYVSGNIQVVDSWSFPQNSMGPKYRFADVMDVNREVQHNDSQRAELLNSSCSSHLEASANVGSVGNFQASTVD